MTRHSPWRGTADDVGRREIVPFVWFVVGPVVALWPPVLLALVLSERLAPAELDTAHGRRELAARLHSARPQLHGGIAEDDLYGRSRPIACRACRASRAACSSRADAGVGTPDFGATLACWQEPCLGLGRRVRHSYDP